MNNSENNKHLIYCLNCGYFLITDNIHSHMKCLCKETKTKQENQKAILEYYLYAGNIFKEFY